MRSLRVLLALAVPVGFSLVALASATAISALVEGTLSARMVLPSVTELRAGLPPPAAGTKVADAILDRNPFDHVAGSLRPRFSTPDDPGPRDLDPTRAPICDGVRPLVLVGDSDPKGAFAALEHDGKRILRTRGGEVGDARVAFVGRERVWLEGPRGLCQALLFGAPPPAPAPRTSTLAQPSKQSALERDIGAKIEKTGHNEYAIDRSAVERILEAQQELLKQRLVQERQGNRVVGVRVFGIKPGSVLAMLGIESGDRLETINGFEVWDPEKMLQLYARLRADAGPGADRLQVHLTRGDRPQNLDYTIR